MIYISKTNISTRQVAHELSQLLHGTSDELWNVYTEYLDISILDNLRALPRDHPKWAGGFVDWPLYLEILPRQPAKTRKTDYVAGLVTLLETLWENGYQAVATGLLEDQLPKRHSQQ